TLGSNSLISMLLAAVLIGLNSPPFDWPGFMSQRSRWLGPLPIHKMIKLLPSFFRAGAIARRLETDFTAGSDAAVKPARCLRKCRGCMPVDIGIPLWWYEWMPQVSVALAFGNVKTPREAAACRRRGLYANFDVVGRL